ncbi:MAG: WGR domain-containing protein [Methylobacteriaceae bacterium]|nr:WGR domain-containing protein [Methylobacteriaceae bacterium]
MPPGFAPNFRLESRDATRNRARFYALSIELTLFGDHACARRFGRIGARQGRVLLGLHASREAALAELARLVAAKRRRGYVIVAAAPDGL